MTQRLSLGYRTGLDGLRAVAVAAVIAFHVLHSYYPDGRYPFSGGFIGVDLFFVLSGFLITFRLLDEYRSTDRVSLRSFYRRRALRLVPAQALLLGCVVLISSLSLAASGDTSLVRKSVPAMATVMTLSANWVSAFGLWDLGPLGPLWSLATEEQFYFLWPLALTVALKRGVGLRTMLLATVALAAASAMWRSVLFARTGSVDRVYYGLDTHADFLLLGCALAIWFHVWGEPHSSRARAWLRITAGFSSAFLLAVACLVEYGDPFMFLGVYSLVSLAALAVVAQVAVGLPAPVARLLEHPIVLWVGRLSYGMYLWHYVVLYLLVRVDVVARLSLGRLESSLLMLALVSLGTAAAAAFSYYTVERRFLVRKSEVRPPSLVTPEGPSLGR